ncbi:MAG: hypothetical protein ABR957_01650, partial [Terracidiphilus sp.]
MKRREFLSSASAVASSCLASHLLRAQSGAPISGTLTINESATLATVPQDFIGLSYESAQLANPAFFSAENTALIALFRELSDQGVLRLGGGTSEFTAFTAEEASHVQKILGPRLIAFQLGNEPDAWRNRYRPATWSYADYWK